MNKSLLAFVVTFIGYISLALAEPASTVTIPIDEYMRLVKKDEKPVFTSVEEAKISGQYRKNLEIQFSGAAVGAPSFINVLEASPDFSLAKCSGNALRRINEGTIQLLPQDSRYKFTCQVIPKNWSEFRMSVLSALNVKVDVKGIEPSITELGGGVKNVAFQAEINRRAISSTDEDLAPSVLSRYHVSVYESETKFEYWFAVNNPNRSAKKLSLKWANNEVVQKISGINSFEDQKNTTVFKVPPGEAMIQVKGRLPKPSFKPLFAKGTAYLLLDNHPMLTLDMKSQARRIAVSDTGMRATFNGARAFLLDEKESFAWNSKKLETFSALSYAVNSLNYDYYWSPSGSSLVEARFEIDNQGTPEIALPIPGTATYLEINGVPQVLSKSSDNSLVLRLPSGRGQNVLVQYQTDKSAGRSIAAIKEDLARPESLLSNVQLDVKMPRNQTFLFAKGLGGDTRWPFEMTNILLALLIGLVCFKLFQEMAFAKRAQLIGAVCGAFIVYFVPSVILPFTFVVLALMGFHYRQSLAAKTPRTIKGWVAVALVAVLVGMVYSSLDLSISRKMSAMNEEASGNYETATAYVNAPAYPAMAKSYSRSGGSGLLSAFGAGAAKAKTAASADENEMMMAEDAAASSGLEEQTMAAVDNYQGLPAKIAMPQDGVSLRFTAGLLDKVNPVAFQIISVSKVWTSIIMWSVFFIFAFVLWRNRQAVRVYAKLN